MAHVERGIGHTLERETVRAHHEAHAAQPSRAEVQAAPYLATFKGQAARFADKAQTLGAGGDHAGALTWAGHAARAAENYRRVREALTPC
jgi:hypothetical protein